MMADQLRLLRKENKLRRACLKEENRQMLDKWIAYAKASDINPYDFELCCKELIGIALQKELEGKDLEHFFGEDAKFVTENIIQGCKKKTWKDYLLFDLRFEALTFACVLIIFDFIVGRLFKPLTLFDFAYYAFFICGTLIFRKIISGEQIRQKLIDQNLNPKTERRSYLSFIFYIVLFIFAFSIRSLMNLVFSGVPAIVFHILIWGTGVILTVFYKKYINELVQACPWQDM